ncbi:MAG: mandelate racemase/muconate lactonizing enzyme family protein, partial [Alphaproteobacteria bacterium]|nr:mandelate racemase/muconate lactonizing enzyme family protein [Alphaproteobacteria bacterium]
MKITSVTADWLHVDIPEDQQHVTDFGRISSFDTTLVRVETDAGLVGHGEARAALSSGGTNMALNTVIEKELGPLIVGEDPRQISRLWDIMYNSSRAQLAIDRGHVFPSLGRRGITICGISGIDIALWDILGQSLGVPVHQLLGGKRHDRMPAYASGGWAPADRIAEELQRFLDRGNFKAVKMRVGAGDGDLAHSVARVHAARDGLGDGIDIMCDAHGTFTVTEAKRFCDQVRDCRIAWFEEPVTADDKRGLAEVRATTDIPVATGESEFTRFDFRDLVELRAADILQPDLSIAGGITETMRIEALCSAWQLRFAAHIWGGATTF